MDCLVWEAVVVEVVGWDGSLVIVRLMNERSVRLFLVEAFSYFHHGEGHNFKEKKRHLCYLYTL